MAVDHRATDRGFTLLEVLVAFIIAALALGALFNGAAASLSSTETAGRYEEAMSRAQSHLAEASHGAPTRLMTAEGREGNGFHWAVRIAPLSVGAPRPMDPVSGQAAPTMALYSVEITESWTDDGRTRQISLFSRRLGVAPP